MNQTMTWFNKQSPVVQLVIVIIVLYLLYQLYLFVSEVTDTLGTQTEIELLQAQGEKPSYSEYQYKQMADRLFRAMDGAGTDENEIIAVFNSLKTTIDFIRVESAFGLRKSSYDYFGTPSDLKDWINGDLDTDTINQINNMLNNKGIKKGF